MDWKAVLGYLFQIIGMLLGIRGAVDNAAKEHTQYALENIAANGTNTVNNPTYGNAALHTQIDTLRTNVLAAIAAVRHDTNPGHEACIQDVLDSLTAGVTVVTLPGFPPDAWTQAMAIAVWLATYQTTGVSFADLLARAGTESWHKAYLGTMPLEQAPHFEIHWLGSLEAGLGPPWGDVPPPLPDWDDIRPSDTTLSWLQRTDQQYGAQWSLDGNTDLPSYYFQLGTDPHTHGYLRCTLHTRELQALRLASQGPRNAAPIWPGSDLVTIGSGIPLAEDMNIAGPLHGVLVLLDSNPLGKGGFTMGAFRYSYQIGYLTFETDAHELEPWSYLGFSSAVYVPRTMTLAESCRIRYTGSATGTVYPWTID